MFRYFVPLIFTLVACSTIDVYGQESLLDASREVTRVIKLRSEQAPPVPTSAQEVVEAAQDVIDPLKIKYGQVQTTDQPTQVKPTAASRREVQPRVAQVPQQYSVQQDFQTQQYQTQQYQVQQSAPTQAQPIQTQPGMLQQRRTATTAQPPKAPSVVSTSSPQVTAEIVAPRFVNLKQTTKMRVIIKNTGTTSVQNVSLIARIPAHVNFITSTPEPENVEGQLYEFLVPDVGPRQQTQVMLDVVPMEKKPIDIETLVTIANRQQLNIGVREPRLQLRIEGKPQINTGQWVDHVVIVENIGDGVATNVQLDTEFPEELRESNLDQIAPISTLAPGNSQKFIVRSFAEGPGQFDLKFNINAADAPSEIAKTQVRILQPELHVAAFGPNVNFVNRGGIYTIKVSNQGEVDVKNVNIKLAVADGMKVTTVNQQATLDKKDGRLVWAFKNIPANTEQTIQLKAIATSIGEQTCTISVASDQTFERDFQLTTKVASRPDVSINISNEGGPVQVGSPTRFKIAVVNRGSSDAGNVSVNVELPSSLTPVENSGYSISPHTNTITFNPMDLKPGGKQVLEFSTVGINQGEHVVRSVLQLDGSQRRIIAEDSVFIFESDEAKVGEALRPAIRR